MSNVSVGRKHIDLFLKKLFAQGNFYERLFNKITKAGCDRETLAGLLFFVSMRARQKEFFDPGDVTTADLKRLGRDLRSLADLVERVNLSPLNPQLDILAAPPDPNRDAIRKHVGSLYGQLPFAMRAYSLHLERFSKFRKTLLKRLTPVHLETLRLLLFVEENTRRPRYEEISDLLTGGFLAAGGAEDKIPEFFSADALPKLKQRTAKLGLNSRF